MGYSCNMFREGLIDKILLRVKRFIPKSVFHLLEKPYHAMLAWAGALIYGFPSRSMKVIGVTGTKGKSTTVFLIAKILEGAGLSVAAVGSLGFKIKDREWPNMLKMTMPGRMKLQKFLYEAKKAGCTHVVLEVTSQGIEQKRHLGIFFDSAVFTGLHPEHIEAHGTFENYYALKQELFRRTKNMHILNADDEHMRLFADFPARKKITFGIKNGHMRATHVAVDGTSASFEVYGTTFYLGIGAEFNVRNALAALATTAMYGIDLPTAKPILEKIERIPGRMDFVQREPFSVVVDYAHTPDSLQTVYTTLKPENAKKLICVLGAAGGGRDRWKRPEFGRIAERSCDTIILTDEDPFDENPHAILEEIKSGMTNLKKAVVVIDRRDAISQACADAKPGDVVVITGKGSETSMALAGGKKIPWSDAEVAREALSRLDR